MKACVVGCERSGTTIISHLVSKGTGWSWLNDPEDSWYIYPLVRLVGVKGFTLSLIYRIWKHDLVKVPGFAAILPELRKVTLGSYKVVYVVRDPRDTVAAIKERLDANLNGLYLNIGFLKKKGGSVAENIAYRWSSYLDTALAYEKKYPKEIFFLKYEDFLSDKKKVLGELEEFLKVRIDYAKIENDLDKQINKSWSKNIKGAQRYKQDLTEEEIGIVEGIAHLGIKKFDY
ncbi:sulfotransferase [Aureisphaera galaxeae]|uniref:sulfotransferase family protein n=1 Tax=Aureisphaera galaxeae TaxID=1538023 RepID=UPI0023500534|nr:sulfotransferase [Aureisphaera galaxeae]MDC8006280.1 sulfotransferase [Aureisphaera galaxeae]